MPNSKGFEMGIAQECQNLSLEQKLNKLIEKGWKPFWFKGEETRIEIERDKDLDIQLFKLNWIFIEQHHRISGSLRNLTSKESGLWQFVCENKMINLEYDITKSYKDSRDRVHHGGYNGDRYLEGFDMYNYKYRIIESALCNEDRLEKFLLDNIKVGNE